MKKISRLKVALYLIAAICLLGPTGVQYVSAISTMSVSPMADSIILTPGEKYDGFFKISNPNTAESDLKFTTSVGSFSQGKDDKTGDDYGSVDVESTSSYNQIKNWITVQTKTGTVAPNETKQIHYTIDVPKDAPAGGQYATILVQDNSDNSQNGKSVAIVENRQIAYIIYAEIAGETREDGEVTKNDIPTFLLNNKLEATSMVQNNGNIHTNAEYTLQVWPLGSEEEICTNEEDPDKSLVMPETERYHTQTCNLPLVGIFHARQVVKIFGETSVIEKNIIVCPIWLLFIIIFAIIALIFWLVMKSKNRKKSAKQ